MAEQYLSIYNDYYVLDTDDGVIELYRGGFLKEKEIDAYTDFYIWYVGFESGSLEVRAVGKYFHSMEECEALVKFNLSDFWRIERLCIDDIDFDVSNSKEYKAKLAKYVLSSKDLDFADKRDLSLQSCIECIRVDK